MRSNNDMHISPPKRLVIFFLSTVGFLTLERDGRCKTVVTVFVKKFVGICCVVIMAVG